MQLFLQGFAPAPIDDKTLTPHVWLTLEMEQRNEVLGVLARVLAKVATAEIVPVTMVVAEEHDHD